MAEIILRLGCSLVAWIIVFAHGLLLTVVPLADCSPQLWRTTLLFAALAFVASGLLPAGLAWRATLRWIAVLALPLWLYGLRVALGLWQPGGGVALCDVLAKSAGTTVASGWERAWAPIQLAAILACALQALRYWRPLREPAAQG